MSLLAPLEGLIRRLDVEASKELAGVKAAVEADVSQVAPLVDKARKDLATAVTDAAEDAAPGLRSDIDGILAKLKDDLSELLKLQ